MVYRAGATPSSSAAPSGYLSDGDREVTDLDKARVAQTGQSRRKILRPFYGLAKEDRVNVVAEGYFRNINAANGH
jgi:hypothetical protein